MYIIKGYKKGVFKDTHKKESDKYNVSHYITWCRGFYLHTFKGGDMEGESFRIINFKGKIYEIEVIEEDE